MLFKLIGTFVHPNGNHVLANPVIEIVLWPKCCPPSFHMNSPPHSSFPKVCQVSTAPKWTSIPSKWRERLSYTHSILEPFARSQKQIPTPAVFTTRTVRLESLQRYRFVQVDRCPSALLIAQWPFNLRTVEKVKRALTESSGCTKLLSCRTLRKKNFKNTRRPLFQQRFLYTNHHFQCSFYFYVIFWEHKNKSQAPKKKQTPTPSQPPQEMFRLEFSKAPIWCPLSSDFFSHFFATKKKGHQPETFHWSTGCLNDGILIMVYNLL